MRLNGLRRNGLTIHLHITYTSMYLLYLNENTNSHLTGPVEWLTTSLDY